MALRIRALQNWQETGRIVPLGSVRGLIAALFWIWAILGFFMVSADFAGLMARRGGEGVGVGSSAFVLMEISYWTAGMIMLGLGALLSRGVLAIQRPAAAEA